MILIAFSPLFYGIRDVTEPESVTIQTVVQPFSPLFYGIRDVTLMKKNMRKILLLTFSPLFYGIRDVTSKKIFRIERNFNFQSPILRDS